MCNHRVDHGTGTTVHALEVNIDHVIELIVRHLDQLSIFDDACIVDQYINAAKPGFDVSNHAGDFFLVRHVNTVGHSFAACRFQCVRQCLRRCEIDVADGDNGAFLDEFFSGRLANTHGGTCDNRYFTL